MSNLVQFSKWFLRTRDYMLDYTNEYKYFVEYKINRVTSTYDIGELSDDQWDVIRAILDGLKQPMLWAYERYESGYESESSVPPYDSTTSYGYNVTLYKYY